MAIKQEVFELPNTELAMSLIKIDKMIATTNNIIADISDKEGTEQKITNLTARSADYQIQKEAIIGRASQEIIPQVVPEEFTKIHANIILNYEANSIIVEYDEDELAEYLASTEDSEENNDKVEEESDNIIEDTVDDAE